MQESRKARAPLPEGSGRQRGAPAPVTAAAPDRDTQPPADLVEVGVLRGAYGLQGWSHVQAHSGDPRVLRDVKEWWLWEPEPRAGSRAGQPFCHGPLHVTAVRAQGAGLVAKWHGCEEPEAAQALKGWRVAVSRAQFPRLPKGQFYWVDLIGTQAVNRSGLVLGRVSGLRTNGAHDVLEIEREEGAQPLLIPMVAAYVDEVDLGGRTIRVDWDPSW